MNTARGGIEEAPTRSLSTRILLSFVVTLVAFAATVGWSVSAQRRASRDRAEVTEGFVPVALKLAQLRATHATIATLVGGIPDERNSLSTRILIETLTSARRSRFRETRLTIERGLTRAVGERAAEANSALAQGIAAAEARTDDDNELFGELFVAINDGNKDDINRIIIDLGAVESDVDHQLRLTADALNRFIDALGKDAAIRERRSLFALFALATLSLVVALFVSFRMRKMLRPLSRITERARAVARGDLVPLEPIASGDELGELSFAFEKMVGGLAAAQDNALSNERFAAIGKMAAHVTHEVRNPLSSIGLNLELLADELEKPGPQAEARSLLKSIGREVDRLERLSEEYLRVAKLPSPRLETNHLPDVLHDVVRLAQPELARSKVQAVLEIEDGLPGVLFDEGQLRQALLNLLRNAREAMPEGGTILVRARKDGMGVSVAVEDEGAGIEEDVRDKIFDPFFSTKGEGTGLGLAITRQIIVQHGGSITCEARSPKGTIFRFSLPIAPLRSPK